MSGPRHIKQPGPPQQERMQLALCDVQCDDLLLEADVTLDVAIARAMEAAGPAKTAWIEMTDAPVSELSYVIPDRSPDDDHVAWYSPPQPFECPGVLTRIGITVGQENDAWRCHAHGLCNDRNERPAMGHLLPEKTRLSRPHIVKAWRVTGAAFERRADPETGFELLQVTGGLPQGGAALVRLAPNQDFAEALDRACATLGWSRTKVQGLGSLIDPHFADGFVLESFATEFLVLDAEAGSDTASGPGPEICVVGFSRDDIRQGVLKRGQNAILITAELLLHRMD